MSIIGICIDDFNTIMPPNDEYEIHRVDNDGKCMEVRDPEDDNYLEWASLFSGKI